ncbi:MAG: type II toxin-antitoxin system RelE/ParE family toxin [Nitrospirales bacterium]|nr:type II toxin-antitoxin system RelE/ParE family toxin [Nitrospira sp.]MDR4487960.1 type II toxin-antitoxin system RelE/ParE family toxin [Nitrospirales bacterium]
MNEKDITPVVWVGDAREQVQSFPKAVRADIGAALYDVQLGEKPPKAKPFKGVASGVLEIVTRFETDTYRTVYAVKIGQRVYVLHAFQKKSPKGKKTASLDVEMITRRYKEALRMEKEYE